jgi:hypothetical protein
MLLTLLTCTGLWLLFPKGFKFMVGSMVGTTAAMFLWVCCMPIWIAHCQSWAAMGWSVLAFVIMGNVAGWFIAAKG